MRLRLRHAAVIGIFLLNSACAVPRSTQALDCVPVAATSALVGARLTLDLAVTRPATAGEAPAADGALNPEVPAAGANVYMADAGGNPLPGLPTGTTNSAGRAVLPDVPPDTAYLLLAPTKNARGDRLPLKTLVKPRAGGNAGPVPINLATTLVTESVVAGLRGQVADLDVAAFEQAVTRMTVVLRTTRAPNLADPIAVLGWLDVALAGDTELAAAIAAVRVRATRPQPSPRPSVTATPTAAPATNAPTPTPTPTPTALPNGWVSSLSPLPVIWPYNATFDPAGAVYVAANSGVVKFEWPNSVHVVHGTSSYGVAVAANGDVYSSESGNRLISRRTPLGITTTVVAPANSAADGIGSPGAFKPWGMAFDAAGNLIFCDQGNHCIRRLAPDGTLTTLAGTGRQGHIDGLANEALFDGPMNLAIGPDGTLYVTDFGSGFIRTISPSGQVATLGKAIPGAAGIAVDARGVVYVSSSNNVIVRIEPSGAAVNWAGVLTTGWSGGGLQEGDRLSAVFFKPFGLAIGPDGVIYVADTYNNKVRRIE